MTPLYPEYRRCIHQQTDHSVYNFVVKAIADIDCRFPVIKYAVILAPTMLQFVGGPIIVYSLQGFTLYATEK